MTPRKLLRIARWEVATATGTVDRRTVLVLAVVALLAGAAAPAAVQGGGLDEGVYLVAVDEDSPYHEPVAEWESLRVVEDPARADVVVAGDGPELARPPTTPKEQAAHAEFRTAVEAYNDRQLGNETDEAAAFPVRVDVRYAEQGGLDDEAPDGAFGGATGDAGAGDDGDANGEDDPSGDGTSEGDASGGSEDGGADDGTEDGGLFSVADDRLPLPDLGGRLGTSQSGTPAEIDPPFPFRSLVLAFLFVIPMNFVVQAYGSTIMDERLNRRGELLLVAPVSRLDVVGGKTLPYAGALAGVTVGIAALIDGGLLSVVAVLPVALLFLALSFLAAMFARSYKELTFLTVTISVLVTTYVFIPAIFADVTSVALISPLTLVVWDLQGRAASLGAVAFSISPFLAGSAVLYGLGLGVYREEDMFTQRPVSRKVLDALAAWIHRPWHVGALSAVLLPFAFVAQLLVLALLWMLPTELSLPLIVVAGALVEEVVKSVHVYAAFEHERFEPTRRTALVLGVASGAGFFVAEKVTHVVQVVGLHELEEGLVAFAPSEGVGRLLGAALFLAPLVLHCVTAAASAVGARRGSRPYLAGLLVAVAVHTLYNLGVIALVT